MTKPSQIQIQLPITSLFTLCQFHPTCVRGNVLSVHLKSDLSTVGIKVAYVTSLGAAFPDLKQTAPQVVLQLCKQLRRDHPERCNVSVVVHSKDSVAPQSTSARLLEGVFMHSHILSNNAKCCHSARFKSSPFNRGSVRPAVVQSSSRTSSWWSCPLSIFLIVRRTVSKSCRQIRFFQSPQLQSDAQMTPLSRGVFSNAAPQNQRTKDRHRTAIPNKKTVKWNISVDGVHTATSASEVMNSSQSEACRCCTSHCSLSVPNRRHYDSPRTCTSVARETSTNLSSSRTGMVRTFLDSAGLQLRGMRSGTLGFAGRGERTVGALGPFATDRHLAILRVVIHGESDDTVASSVNH